VKFSIWKTVPLVFLLSSFNFSAESKTANPPAVKFEKAEMTLVAKKITVELAQSQEQQAYGLMNRTSLPENTGMLFVFLREETRSFWMKNTFVDLSIGFFDQTKKLVDIQDMKAVKSVMEEAPSYISRKPAQYALEVPKGWFQKNKIKLGDTFTLKK